MKIQVTWKHINEGTPRNNERNAVALAMHNSGMNNLSVGYEVMWWNDPENVRHVARMPYEVGSFLYRYDNQWAFHREIAPFSFEVDTP